MENASPEEMIWLAFTLLGLVLNVLESLDARHDLQAVERRHALVLSSGLVKHRDVLFLQRIDMLRLVGNRTLRAAVVRSLVFAMFVAVGALSVVTPKPARPALETLGTAVSLVFILSALLLVLNSVLDRRDRGKLLEQFEHEEEKKIGVEE